MPAHLALATRPAIAAAAAAVAISLLALDLLFLGVLAKGLFDRALGPLKADPVNWPAALLFYVFYVTAIVAFAVVPAATVGNAALRGLALGAVAYGTYELTNWAVIAGWPAWLVPIDIAWGLVLTSSVAAIGSAVYLALHAPS